MYSSCASRRLLLAGVFKALRTALCTSQYNVISNGELSRLKSLSWQTASLQWFHSTVPQCTHSVADRPKHDFYVSIEKDLTNLYPAIKKELNCQNTELRYLSHYHFDGHGKAFRPAIVLLMAKACNQHIFKENFVLFGQKRIAQISEMIHVASLIHDDVIDESAVRRGKESVHKMTGQRKAILTGDYILSVASQMLAKIGNEQVMVILSRVLEDLVKGEFMQLGSKEDESERFSHYLRKTFKKTASLIANSCKAVAVLAGAPDDIADVAYRYGRNVGIAFQLVDDMLDFTSSDAVLGKPTTADLHLGLATAPVLFAAEQYPELHAMILRRFAHPGDVEHARSCVSKSRGLEQTKLLSERHGQEAKEMLQKLRNSLEQEALLSLVDFVLHRLK